jgi:hypothetical protein
MGDFQRSISISVLEMRMIRPRRTTAISRLAIRNRIPGIETPSMPAAALTVRAVISLFTSGRDVNKVGTLGSCTMLTTMPASIAPARKTQSAKSAASYSINRGASCSSALRSRLRLRICVLHFFDLKAQLPCSCLHHGSVVLCAPAETPCDCLMS